MLMPPISCKALLVDMDGVLVDSTPAVARVWTRWALKHNLDPDYVVHFAHGRTSLTSIRELLPQSDAAVHLEENRWMERGEIEEIADVVALPGAHQLLALVPPSQLCVVTSSTRALAEVRLRATDLWPHVVHLVTASDIVHGKPDPEPYLKGAAALHLDPQYCVVIEDAPFGIRSGKAAGTRVLAVRTTVDDPLLLAAGADWVMNDCSSLRISPSSPASQLVLELSPNEARRQPTIK
ncbi:MAG TPA: HAD-IA family hydrolase [Candidatus Acidoferrales bacterium]|jgi:sugar-phosphatase|nr:HAD-IA family hydrolase [Candidatus Acidoferrales bacterium]